MASRMSGGAQTLWACARAILLLTALLGVGYTAAVTGAAQILFPDQANGSPARDSHGTVVGSALIGQSFDEARGIPLPQYFQPRPSAAGKGYDATASGGSNLGPDNPSLARAIDARRAQIAEFNHVPPAAVPPDAVTASGSGLDPDISPAYALLQVDRVAAARHLPRQAVRDLVDAHVQGPDLGYLGQWRVNVLELNLALDRLKG